ncbi:hypothetical protein SUNI508_08628 [Seiridium unicorne]|uniref:Uncharacterized protein n=1 Tax=Seiridium unicorne TaxID=138068 RepID=A0ABR2UTI7_9PEZI
MTDRPKPVTTSTTQSSQNSVWNWKEEIAGLIFPVGLIAAIFAILGSFDGRRLSDWTFGINVNTIAALLSTVFRSALVAIVAQVISQAEWLWFSSSTSRQLIDLDRFDTASRAACGAAKLLPTVYRHNLLVFLCASVAIVSLAIGPFVQQAVGTMPCQWAAEKEASTSIVRNLTAEGMWDTGYIPSEAPPPGEVYGPIEDSSGTHPLARIQIPCRVADQNYVTHNMSSAADASLRNSTIITADGISPVLLDISPVCHYTVARPAADAQADVLQSIFNRTCEALLTPDAIEPGASLNFVLNCQSAWWLNSLFNEFNATAGSINLHMESFALAMSNEIRLSASQTIKVIGTNWDTDVCIKIRWTWVIFPAVLVFLRAIELGWIIMISLRHNAVPTWKRSTLPFLLNGDCFKVKQGVEHEEIVDMAPSMSLEKMESAAKRTYVILPPTNVWASDHSPSIYEPLGPFYQARARKLGVDSLLEE